MTSTVVIAVLAAFGGGLVRAILAGLLGAELKGMLNERLKRHVRRIAVTLPPEQSADLEAEWLAELATLQDRPLRAVAFARGLAVAARGLSELARDTRTRVRHSADSAPSARNLKEIVPVLTVPPARRPAPARAVIGGEFVTVHNIGPVTVEVGEREGQIFRRARPDGPWEALPDAPREAVDSEGRRSIQAFGIRVTREPLD